MTELKKALQQKILEFEECKNNPNHQSEMEQNAVQVTLRELKYLDSLAEFEQLHNMKTAKQALIEKLLSEKGRT